MKKIIVILMLILLVLVIGCKKNDTNTISTESQGNKLATKSSQSTVEIDLTPHKVSSGNLVIDIAMNTHSIELSRFDLSQLIELEYDSKLLKPKSAPSFQSHHGTGQLVFDVKEDISNFKVIVRDIPDIEERVFEWP